MRWEGMGDAFQGLSSPSRGFSGGLACCFVFFVLFTFASRCICVRLKAGYWRAVRKLVGFATADLCQPSVCVFPLGVTAVGRG